MIRRNMKRIGIVAGSIGLAFAMSCAGKLKSTPGGTNDSPPSQTESDQNSRRTSRPSKRTPVVVPPRPQVPSAAAAVEQPDPAFQNLAVVNGKPFHDMYFKHYGVNPTIDTDEEPVSTFAIDVDTASYSVSRSYLNRGHLPEEEAVRVEEFVNSFDYKYSEPDEGVFSISVEGFPSPNRKGYHVLHVGLKGKEVTKEERKPANLVFVIDVSGSMNMENRLGLVKKSLALLVDQLDDRDSVGIVIYGDRAETVLKPTWAGGEGNKDKIMSAIHGLRSGGSTNAQAGILLGYKMASKHFREDGINRVILCSDGVANNGITGAGKINKTIKKEADQGVTISTVGFGMGNYNDILMEKLADIGNGNYAYVDTLAAARKLFVEQLTGTLQLIAKDVKIQVRFDDKQVARYRLLGFENRMLEEKDFDNDKIDAGEIGAGHTVTAIYEVKFRAKADLDSPMAQLRIRHKKPNGWKSHLTEKQLPFGIIRDEYAESSPPTKLSMVAAAFAEKLRGSYWVRNLSYDDILALWNQIPDPLRQEAEVAELRTLIEKAKRYDRRGDKFEDDLPLAQMDYDKVPDFSKVPVLR